MATLTPPATPTAGAMQLLATRIAGPPAQPDGQDTKTIWILRLSVGVIGTSLPVTLLIWNAIKGVGTIVPASMSGSYYTSARNLFVGSLCALGVFLFGYRHTTRQNRCTWFAGVCAVLVAFNPTAPARPLTEPAWINVVHHLAAIALIGTLGVFCWVIFFAEHAKSVPRQAKEPSLLARLGAFLTTVLTVLRQKPISRIYFGAGLLVFLAGLLALYTGLWPTGWSTGWPSLYLFEGVAVFSFGSAWIVAAFELRSAQESADSS